MGNASHAGEGRGPLGCGAPVASGRAHRTGRRPDRNLAHLRERLLQNTPLDPAHIYAMPRTRPTGWEQRRNMR
jgi:hypothetical protein